MEHTLTVNSKLSPFPYAAVALATHTDSVAVVWEEEDEPLSFGVDGKTIHDEGEIVDRLVKSAGLSEDSEKSTKILTLCKQIPSLSNINDVIATLNQIDDYLAYRTFVVGHQITSADFILWGSLKASIKVLGALKNKKHLHVLRYMSHLESSVSSIQSTLQALVQAKAQKAKEGQKVAAGFGIGLDGAKEGQVVVRFPPEPSGYLHIGHAKAAMLNQYFAKMYKGKLIIRFDDTNPSKERAEFEQTILEDLLLLGITPDVVTYTSDHFQTLHDLAIKMIKTGKAYADNTPREQMQHERREGIESAHRNDSVEDNLAHFAEMTKGTEEGQDWCLRAKLSVDNPNKSMRDPVIYRCNPTSHHRTGDKWKVYPTYDFACPVVDSLEGVTHALRTNEYRDRNDQYWWMIDALGLRKVKIWDFSRLNFVYTLLSKRKLHYFVDKGLVTGWDDPRFPTVRGVRRRGLTVEALRQFMLLQGPSQAINHMEYDVIWAINKKVLDPIAPRFWCVSEEKLVTVTISGEGTPSQPEVKKLPKHKKNPEIGEKVTVFFSKIILDQEDAVSFEDNEEITLMDWGNAVVKSKTLDPSSGYITSLEMELNLSGDFKKTKKKITWLAHSSSSPHPLVPVVLLDYDYLITKKKLEDSDNLDDFITPVTEFKEFALADANVKEVKKGEIIQFERKGFFSCDGISKTEDEGRIRFIRIPDGKAASLASKAAAPAPIENVSKGKEHEQLPGMYKVGKIYGDDATFSASKDNKMYQVESIY